MRYGRVARVAGVFMAFALGGFSFVQPARADLAIHVDKSRQQMTVALNGEPLFVWAVSTGAAGYDTPSGTFTPFRMEKDHFSKEWDDAPMPHSVFFTMKGHAIHGSTHIKALGTPASHGCVRLEPANARILFDLVKQEGLAKTRVSITGETPSINAPPVAQQRQSPSRAVGFAGFFDGGDVVGSVPPPPVRRGERLARDYRERPRDFYVSERPYFHPPRYGNAAPPPFYFGR